MALWYHTFAVVDTIVMALLQSFQDDAVDNANSSLLLLLRLDPSLNG